MKKDSELFRPLVNTAERYLRDYCDGKQESDEKAMIALSVLSLYRRILKVEKERKEIRSEWERLLHKVKELGEMMRRSPKRRTKEQKKKKSRSSRS
jgi:hypothetical protein